MNTKIKEVLESLDPLFKKAKNENLWFYHDPQDLWFSPQELQEKQAEGRFLWGAVNWQLRNPLEKITELERKKENINKSIDKEIKKFQSRIMNH